MNDSRPDDSELPPFIELIVDEDTGENRFHVRDDEAAIAQLPPCVLAPLELSDTTRVALGISPVTLRLPSLPPAEPMEVPDDGTWQGWEWAAHEHLLVNVVQDPRLPRVPIVTVPKPGLWRLDVLGRPMCVWRAAPGDAGWAANAYLAEVHGFLDDATQFWAQVVAPTVARREQLLAAVATLERSPSSR